MFRSFFKHFPKNKVFGRPYSMLFKRYWKSLFVEYNGQFKKNETKNFYYEQNFISECE